MGLHEKLYQAIQTYAAEVSGHAHRLRRGSSPISSTTPTATATISSEEATMANRYASWTPRLLKAAYNYQFVAKDPGAYTHNPSYRSRSCMMALTLMSGIEEMSS
jgi:hypothetical protein